MKGCLVVLIVLGVVDVILILCSCLEIGKECKYAQRRISTKCRSLFFFPGYDLCPCFEEEKPKTSRAANILTGVAATGHEIKTKLAAGLQRNTDVEAQVQNGKEEEGKKKKNSKTSMAVGLLTDAAAAGGSLVKEKAKRIPLPTSFLGRKE